MEQRELLDAAAGGLPACPGTASASGLSARARTARLRFACTPMAARRVSSWCDPPTPEGATARAGCRSPVRDFRFGHTRLRSQSDVALIAAVTPPRSPKAAPGTRDDPGCAHRRQRRRHHPPSRCLHRPARAHLQLRDPERLPVRSASDCLDGVRTRIWWTPTAWRPGGGDHDGTVGRGARTLGTGKWGETVSAGVGAVRNGTVTQHWQACTNWH